MPIADTDPDELDDDLDDDGRPRRGSGSRRRKLSLLAGAAVVIAGGIAGAVALSGGNDQTTDPATTTAVETADTIGPDIQPGINVGPNPNGFPDYGSDYMGPQLETMLQRTTDSGIRMTLQNSGDWQNFAFADGDSSGGGVAITSVATDGNVVTVIASGGVAPPPPVPGVPPNTGPDQSWVAPAWCNPVGGFRLTMLYKDAVGISNGSRYGEPRDGVSVTLFSSGYAEGVPFRALVVNVADDVVGVTATWDDDASDTAVPVNGWVVVATPGPASGKFVLVLQTDGGERTIAWDELPQDGDLDWQKGCSPPPPDLPLAGDQPDDAQGAEAQIRANFAALFDNDVPFEEKGDLIDDTTGIQDAIDQLQVGGFADAAQTAKHTITDLVFVSPDEAWFRYDLQTIFSDFQSRFGIAYLIDGQWRIARAVMCQDLALTGISCNPPVNDIYPALG
ncbi:hypothetical protein BH10ACT2_BH10ACT2_16320 [soil metagenome]